MVIVASWTGAGGEPCPAVVPDLRPQASLSASLEEAEAKCYDCLPTGGVLARKLDYLRASRSGALGTEALGAARRHSWK